MDYTLQKILEIKAVKRISDAKMASDLGLYPSAFTDWKNKRSKSYLKHLAAIADYLGVTEESLMSPTSQESIFTLDGAQMVPIVGEVKAGYNGGITEDIDGYMPAYGLTSADGYVWVRVRGDSMEPEIREGDYVLVRRQNIAENGQIIACMYNGEDMSIKKYERSENGDFVLLTAYNPKVSNRFISKDALKQFYIYGVCIEIKRFIKNG